MVIKLLYSHLIVGIACGQKFVHVSKYLQLLHDEF